jgi:excisionase family DNA binding protein
MASIFENYLDVLEACKILRVHSETVKRLIREGKLPATKFGNKWLIDKEHLLAFTAVYNRRRGRRGTT